MSAFNPHEPHNGLPALVTDLPIDLPKLMPLLIEARVQVARLDELASMLPNPMALVNAIAVVEAQGSSAIENIVTTNDTLFQSDAFLNSESVRQPQANFETRMVMRNRSALQSAYRFVERAPVSANLARQICSEILGHEVSIRHQPGTYIGSAYHRVYTPPSGKEVIETLLSKWQDFTNSATELDPLILMALSHYQFEAIHPFIDGNGRTGRILNVAFLVEKGLLKHPVIHLSRAINQRREEYYERLLAVTARSEWHEWVRFMLEIVAQSAIRANQQIVEINNLHKNLMGSFRGAIFKRGVSQELALLLFQKPYCRIGHVAEACEVSRPTAAKWLEELETLGFLTSVRIGREKYFVNWQMIKILE